MIHDGTGSVCGFTCWYLVALDQYKPVMVDGTGSVYGDTGWDLGVLGQLVLVLLGIR